ncbi:tyrosine-type recombinase/integrase [Clostridium botulinum]|uniref:site-specific tyrosine recombinase/integron integrase n=1 Tax=Clostridium botulinum TaxID=1491 RepID=UPI0006A73D86|nr:site-specific tyrosine recombinase/integron integrase [Clostridium botulinum]KON10080.1 integrase [Clostridium botulinum]MBY6907044.1 tyrosine-type recombinase/integrase [Clostridium botulinum]MBY6928558.1 tyrosine-type recombinase/integrase [Clostridium botulinum]MBY6956153.1 tyrosine-type recombinase/integrase [Clostridium botulinum]NFH08450.1 integrase [Clostridium botulinum]
MYSSSAKDEVIIKLVGKLSMEFTEIDQLKVRAIAEEVLYKYSVLPEETALVSSDIEEKLQIYLASKKLDGLSIGTLRNYKYNLARFADHLRKPLGTITTMDLRMFLAIRCKSMKQTSVNGQITILKSFFSWLYDEEYIPKNPAAKLKQTKEPKRLRHALSEEEIELLRQACKTDREKALIEFLISTGCRLSEVVGIDKNDIDWNEMSLNVIGKGNKERKIYFSTKAKILLKKYLLARSDENIALFVTSKKPHGRLGGRSVQREIKKIADRAGINKSIYPHLFRHSFATSKLNAGMPLPVIQHLMGHENPATTQIYAELSEENIKHEYKKIS